MQIDSFLVSNRDHMAPLPVDLHWLLVTRRIEYTIATVLCDSVSNISRSYFSVPQWGIADAEIKNPLVGAQGH